MEQHIQELRDFKHQHGHCRVPNDDEEYKKLSTWIHQIRSAYARLQRGDEAEICLTEECIAELKSIGLRLSMVSSEARGKRRLKELIEFRRVHGHFQVPRNCTQFPRLSSWLAKLRIVYHKRQRGEDISILVDTQLSALEKIGYDFHHSHVQNSQKRNGNRIRKRGQQCGPDLDGVRWNQRVQELQKFKEKHGHFKVPANAEEYKYLYSWVRNNQHHYNMLEKGEKSSRLTSERISQLAAIGFEFNGRCRKHSGPDLDGVRWNQRVEELRKFKEKHGHFNIPSNTEAYISLLHWVKNNQHHYNMLEKGEKSSRLTSERISQLAAIGFDFNERCSKHSGSGPHLDNVRWNQMVQELQKFKEEHGHFKVPADVEAYKTLYSWVTNNQSHYNRLQKGEKSPRLTSERISQLTAIGFHFNEQSSGSRHDDVRWNQRVQELRKFKEKHGHFNIPSNTEAYKALFFWMSNNQIHYSKLQKKGEQSNRLTSKRISQLKAIGFDFASNRKNKSWNKRFQELKDFKDAHGHFNVPIDDVEEHKSLRMWVNNNQWACNKFRQGESGRITTERLKQLREIGFRFNDSAFNGPKCRHARWNHRVQELKEFHDAHGHFDVPLNVERYKPLANWMLNNRQEYNNLRKGVKSSRLTSERLVQLTEIGFQFNQPTRRMFDDSSDINAPSCPIARWNQRVQELKDFYDGHGHFKVPKNTEAYNSLYGWLRNNQTEYNSIQMGIKSSRLTDQRIGQLKSIGFHFADTGRRGEEWDEGLNELKEFKEVLGHFDVPNDDDDYQSLRQWIAKNQEEYVKVERGEKSSRLTPGRLRRLGEIGFHFKSTLTSASIPKDTAEYEECRQGGSSQSSESKSDSDEEVEVNDIVKQDGSNNSQTKSPPAPQLESATSREALPESASATVDLLPQEESQKLAVSSDTRNSNQALMPSFLLGLDDVVNAMMAEMNRVELEQKTSESHRNATSRGKPNQFWLDIGDCDGIEFF
eukprot:CAMPEP_0113656942 /NCGR_PEP_ID=MMETSP0017_2-20120614/30733_1 /TAXON_ID=2856 /ORGANISM="Cylindrotheca closterium" /LENGTH=982 /DNA_ID=CAMNT_0000570739 /DNA_START=80 /DNA_END=3028 /DNA_ORIENTATION=- /assembly_acc=CAM_ASM_000147